MSEKLLEVKDLSIHYVTEDGRVKACDGVNFWLNKGETLGLVGETGAGKTTTALGIMNLVPDPPGVVENGEVYFQEENLLEKKEAQLKKIRGNLISMIFQDPMTSLNPVITIGEQIAEGIQLHQNLNSSDAMEKAKEMLEVVGLPKSRANDYPHQFSGGMKQRVVIAIALACNPSLLIADEPTTALDVTIQAQVLEVMKDLVEEFETSMLMITHDLGIVADACDKVAIMYTGKIVEFTDKKTLFTSPKHPYTKGLFGSIPSLDDDEDRLNPIKGLMPEPTELPEGCPFNPRCPKAIDVCKEVHPEEVITNEGENSEHRVLCHMFDSRYEHKFTDSTVKS
ncbi:ABC transporter ATP-binding protein [Natranaerobius trueperi]|uniref:Dipeptide/oligopeptide/nickel ABC transporter ATP-binding protein n=1 Tax=Natranaerobius trueperi TaxID=759412 RepID=A0A226C306_9FIRM|nr:ABC transporter ATP-binding protein [Natranaerobius trueperi]OWZ85014.1 dipeptide/oligopeptide/nickel ABC transporter ATP-binding protein [Natranaerobius trueperi]